MTGDVSQMYHQIHLRPGDRPQHRFLYKDLGTGDTPKVYEFKRVLLPILCPVCLATSCQT